MQLIGGEGKESKKLLGVIKFTLSGIQEKSFTIIEKHAVTAEGLVRDLDIEDSIYNPHYHKTINHI